MADYRLEWARFADWCESAGREPLPATESTVLAYLAEESSTSGTAVRWVAAIRARHRVAGVPDPRLGTVKALLRTARKGGGTDADAMLNEAGQRVLPIAQLGWPNGVFGRRDRLAFLLHRLGPCPFPRCWH